MLSLIGYLNTLSAAPGDVVEVKVGAYGARTYRADLQRVVQGDRNPEGPGYKAEAVALDLGGQRTARQQPLLPGSYARISDQGGVLAGVRSFSIAVPIWPTKHSAGEQSLIALGGSEIELFVSATGKPCVRAGSAELSLSRVLPLNQWTLVVASFEATTRVLQLSSRSAQGDLRHTTEMRLSHCQLFGRTSHVMIAAKEPGRNHYNGKMDSPALFDRAISTDMVATLMLEPQRLVRMPELVAYWDFSCDISGTRIRDASPHRLDGTLYQCPLRAATGWRWHGETLNWTERPDLYTAIHFHADDLTDAGWDTDFAFEVPAGLRSGIYSVRLVPDGEDANAYHCVFAIRPSRSTPSRNPVVFLMPTASYIAYANHRLGLDVPGTEMGMGHLVELDRHHIFLQQNPELGLSFYEVHGDGSGVIYSSRNRPIVDLQPGVRGFLGGLGSNVWQFNADTHIIGWLENADIPYDVITDEDLHREGLSLLRQYRMVITGTHPEYYSLQMLDAVQGFVNRGGRLMYLGGNGFYWRISFSDEHPGVVECRRSETGVRPWEPGLGQYYHAFTGEYGGLWRRNGRPSGELTGLVMSSQGFDVSEPYVLCRGAGDARVDFMWQGVDRTEGRQFGDFGLCGGGAAGLEIDRADPTLGTPEHVLVLGSSQRHTDTYLMTPEDLLDPTPDWTGTQSDQVRSDLVFFETPNGGAVFSTGSIAWAGAMACRAYKNEVSLLTLNVLSRFLDPKPFPHPGVAGPIE